MLITDARMESFHRLYILLHKFFHIMYFLNPGIWVRSFHFPYSSPHLYMFFSIGIIPGYQYFFKINTRVCLKNAFCKIFCKVEHVNCRNIFQTLSKTTKNVCPVCHIYKNRHFYYIEWYQQQRAFYCSLISSDCSIAMHFLNSSTLIPIDHS